MDFSLSLTLGFIGWFILIVMAAGIFLIKMTETILKKEENGEFHLDDLTRDIHIMFLNQYYDTNVGGRISFLILYGAKFLGMILFKKFNKE